MAGVLGIDAAWTEKEPSAVALLEGSPGGWRCVAVAPNYDSFLSLAEGTPVDWTLKARRAVPDASRLVAAAEKLLDGNRVCVVTVDMPLSTAPIAGRREADSAVSKAFGNKGCAAHSPNAERPGRISEGLRDGFAEAGFSLATAMTAPGTPTSLVEVYPHPALLTLTGADYRLPYKVSKSRRYWPGSSPADRKVSLIEVFERILTALKDDLGSISLELPDPAGVVSLSGLKRYEDSVDSLVCAWVGTKYLEGNVTPYGDDTAAIWVP